MKTMGDLVGNGPRAAAIQRLLELGALRTTYMALTPEIYQRLKETDDSALIVYECTEFGKAVVEEAAERLKLRSPEMIAVLEKSYEEERLRLQGQVNRT
jgi:hypothetical protein